MSLLQPIAPLGAGVQLFVALQALLPEGRLRQQTSRPWIFHKFGGSLR